MFAKAIKKVSQLCTSSAFSCSFALHFLEALILGHLVQQDGTVKSLMVYPLLFLIDPRPNMHVA